MKTKLTTIFKKSANTPPMWVCLLFALVISTNSWADPTDVTWDGKTGAMFPSGSAGSPASDTKSGITLTTNCPAANAFIANRNPQCYSYEVAPSENYIDITTNGQELTNVNVSIVYIGGSGANSVKVSFSSGASFDGDALLGSSPYTITGTNEQQGDVTCEITAPSGAKSARIFRTDTGWGPYLHRIRVIADEATPCSTSVTISYKKSGSETGSAPADREVCTDNTSTITLPGKNTLVYDDKHVFVGWEKGGVTYAEGNTYTITSADISAGSIEFTAVWSEVNVTDLTITNPENNTIPLSWKIPGICDIKKGKTPIFTPDNGQGSYGSLSNSTYEDEGDFITANGNSPIYGQYGIGFDIPATTEFSWLSYEWKGYGDGIILCGAVCDNSHAYWQGDGSQSQLNNNSSFTATSKLYPSVIFWAGGSMSAGTKVSQVAIFANGGTTNGSFSVRNVRYGITGRADIDHIVLVRKAGSVPANKEDGDVIYTGTKSHFTDTDVKTSGTTYFYAVFAVYSDASVSSPVYVSHTIEAATEYTVTYAKGADNVTGDVPTEGNHIEGAQFTVAGKNTLARPGHHFAGWNDGTTDYAVGDTYTMPAGNVTLTAQWTPFTVPTISNLAITNAVNNTIPLSWSIPGKLDLSTATTDASYFYDYRGPATFFDYDPASEELSVTYDANAWDQKGVAFPIVLSNLETITFESKGHRVFPEAIYTSETKSYWENDPMATSDDWKTSTMIINTIYPNSGSVSSVPNVDAITFCSNPSDQKKNETFHIRDVFYHTTGMVDIDHVVLMRKVGSAATGIDDAEATQLYSGTLSHFTDSEEKTIGTTYYYTVFAVDEDNYVSAATTVSATITNDTPHTVTYAKGDESVTGSVPTDDNTYVEGNNVTLAAIGDLAWSGHIFMGWSDGTDTYKPGDSYTMTDNDVTFTAQWRDIETPLIIPTGTTHLDANNYYDIPGGTYSMDVDGTGASTCIDIAGNKYAEWIAKFTSAHYKATLTYGTTGYTVDVILKIYDGETEVKATAVDHHSDGSGVHTYQRTWGLDLTDLDPDKVYKVRVIDAYSDASSNPKVGYLDFEIVVPTDISNTASTRLDYTNVSVDPGTVEFDIKNNGNSVTCLDIKDHGQADWYVYITPDVYDINMLYGTPEYSTNVTFSIINPATGSTVFAPAAMTHSGAGGTPWYEDKTWNNVDLSGLDANKQYIVRVVDTYPSTGSKPKVQYITFSKHEVIQIGAFETVLNASNTISTVATATDIDIDGDGNNDACMNLQNTYAEWEVNITRGVYTMMLEYGVSTSSSSALKVQMDLIDPSGVEATRRLLYHYISNDVEGGLSMSKIATRGCDFSEVTEGKRYIIRVTDAYPNCKLRVRNLTFEPFSPVQIPTTSCLNASNVFTPDVFAYNNFDVDGDDANDECLYIRNHETQGVSPAEWKVNITPGVYKMSVVYGAPSTNSYDITVSLVDPEVGGEGTQLYTKHVSGSANIVRQNETVSDIDWTNLTAGKEYIIRVASVNGSTTGNKLYFGSMSFERKQVHTRTGLTVGNYGTICLPYAVAAENRNGAELFEIEEWGPNGSSLTISELNADENMIAGRPYIFQATAATATFRYYAEGDETEAGKHNGLVGSYEQALIPLNDDNYIIYNNKLYLVNSEAYVGANRAYIHKQDQVQPAPAYRRRVTLSVNGAQVITDIDQINDPAQMTKYIENGHLFIFREGKVYNAQGQLVK